MEIYDDAFEQTKREKKMSSSFWQQMMNIHQQLLSSHFQADGCKRPRITKKINTIVALFASGKKGKQNQAAVKVHPVVLRFSGRENRESHVRRRLSR